jgi:hypothetical protein
MSIAALKQDIARYATGKTWYWYMLPWIGAVLLFVGIAQFKPGVPLPLPIAIIQAVDFVVHELSHIIWFFLPPVLVAASGSLAELAVGLLAMAAALKTRKYFALVFACLWYMLAAQSAGAYMADARAQQMQLVSPGGALSGSDSAIHDWHFVFGQLGLLDLDSFIGGGVRLVGVMVGLLGLVLGAWLISQMAVNRQAAPLEPKEADLLAQAEKDAQSKGKNIS